MNPVFIVIAVVSVLFAALLAGKTVMKWKFCVICMSVSATWIALFLLYRLGRFPYPVVIAVLMGQSVVGAYYLAEKRVREHLLLFRLPLLLTLTAGAYVLLGEVPRMAPAALFLGVLWALFGIVYAYRHVPSVRKMTDRVIACCRDW